MNAGTINEKVKMYLKDKYAPCAALCVVVMLSCLCANLFGIIGGTYVDSFMFYQAEKPAGIPWNTAAVAVITLATVFFWIEPMRLSIKAWYTRLSVKNLPVSVAFKSFTSAKRYVSALYFSFVRRIADFGVCFLLLLFPSVLLAAVSRRLDNFGSINSVGGLLLILSFVLIILAAVFSVYFLIGFFFADYLFAKGITYNPIKAMKLSVKLSRENKGRLISVMVLSLPYYLVCVFVVTIPFALPKIKAMFAVLANEVIDAAALNKRGNDDGF